MKDPEEFDAYLNSDAQQTIALLEEKLSVAMMALRDIHVWAEDLSQAKNIARYTLVKIDELQIVYSVEIREQK